MFAIIAIALGASVGLAWASLVRFLTGLSFHWLPSWEIKHEPYHEILRQRILFHKPLNWRDEVWESGIQVVQVVLTAFVCTRFMIPSMAYSVVMGMILEFMAGTWIRLQLQYPLYVADDATILADEKRQWMRAMKVYYWWHLFQDPQTCMGFSSPCWDLWFQWFPKTPINMRLHWTCWIPIPYLCFVFVDLDAMYTHLVTQIHTIHRLNMSSSGLAETFISRAQLRKETCAYCKFVKRTLDTHKKDSRIYV